jgi:hypothetical protein
MPGLLAHLACGCEGVTDRSPDDAIAHSAQHAEPDATLCKDEGVEICPADVSAWFRVAAQFWSAAGEIYDVLGVGRLSAAF